MWPFRRRAVPRSASTRLGDLSADPDDYPVLTVGQSRLGDSFRELGFGDDSEPRTDYAIVTPIIDPSLKVVADITISVDGQIVGYLRPPDLNQAAALIDEHHTETLEVPCRLFWSPAGPEVNLRLP